MFTKAHPFYTVILPIIIFVAIALLDRRGLDFLPGITGSEFGFVELSQTAILTIAFLWGGNILLSGRYRLTSFIKMWLALTLLAVMYINLEEISYGQHFFAWTTPETWMNVNDQGETNIHNTSSWFDQKPRLILLIGVIIGGIIVPVLRRYKPSALPEKYKDILPADALIVTAVLAVVPYIYDKILDMTPYYGKMHPFVRVSEVQELYFYYFMLLYYVYLPRNLIRKKA